MTPAEIAAAVKAGRVLAYKREYENACALHGIVPEWDKLSWGQLRRLVVNCRKHWAEMRALGDSIRRGSL